MIVFINHLLSTVGQMLFSRLTRWFSGGRGLKQKCHPLGGGGGGYFLELHIRKKIRSDPPDI